MSFSIFSPGISVPGSLPYDLTNGGARSLPFAATFPTAPSIDGPTVDVSNIVDLQTAIDAGNRVINIGSGLTLSGGNVYIRGTDVEVNCPNSTTFDGTHFWWGNYNTTRPARIKWTGGNLVDGGMYAFAFNDLLIDDLYVDNLCSVSNENVHNFSGFAGTETHGWQRLAILNSTFGLRGGGALAGGSGWALFVGGDYGVPAYDDLIIANTKFLEDGNQVARIMGVTNLIIADSVFNPTGEAINGLRLHHGCTNVWLVDGWSRNIMMIGETDAETDPGPGVVNAVFERFDRYALDGAYTYGDPPNANSGILEGCTLYSALGAGDGSTSVLDFTDGSGNSREAWDGSTVPDHSLVGAVR